MKGLPEDIDTDARVGPMEFFVESADEDGPPKAIDSPMRLSTEAKPFEHGDAAGYVKLWRLALVLDDMQHGPGNRQFVEKCERSKRREGAGEVKRSGKDTGFYFPAAALGIEEEEAVKEFDFAGRAYAAVKIFEIRTTAESHVLAIKAGVLPAPFHFTGA